MEAGLYKVSYQDNKARPLYWKFFAPRSEMVSAVTWSILKQIRWTNKNQKCDEWTKFSPHQTSLCSCSQLIWNCSRSLMWKCSAWFLFFEMMFEAMHSCSLKSLPWFAVTLRRDFFSPRQTEICVGRHFVHYFSYTMRATVYEFLKVECVSRSRGVDVKILYKLESTVNNVCQL